MWNKYHDNLTYRLKCGTCKIIIFFNCVLSNSRVTRYIWNVVFLHKSTVFDDLEVYEFWSCKNEVEAAAHKVFIDRVG